MSPSVILALCALVGVTFVGLCALVFLVLRHVQNETQIPIVLHALAELVVGALAALGELPLKGVQAIASTFRKPPTVDLDQGLDKPEDAREIAEADQQKIPEDDEDSSSH